MKWKKHKDCELNGEWMVVKDPVSDRENPFEFKCNECNKGWEINVMKDLSEDDKKDIDSLIQKIKIAKKVEDVITSNKLGIKAIERKIVEDQTLLNKIINNEEFEIDKEIMEDKEKELEKKEVEKPKQEVKEKPVEKKEVKPEVKKEEPKTGLTNKTTGTSK